MSATEARPKGEGGRYLRADGGGGEGSGRGGCEGNRGKGEAGGHEGVGGVEDGRAGFVEQMEAAREFTWEAAARVAGEMVAEARVAVGRAVELAWEVAHAMLGKLVRRAIKHAQLLLQMLNQVV